MEWLGVVDVFKSKNSAIRVKILKNYTFTNYLEILEIFKQGETKKQRRKNGRIFPADFVEGNKSFLDLISNLL
jgi:hypothetical protein